MLDQDTKRRIDTARQILVGKIPDPKAQVEQITTALIYKFMDDMDRENEELGGKAKFLTGKLKQYSWGRLLSKELSGQERMLSYIDALTEFSKSEQIPELFRTIFKGTFLPYRDPETLNLFLKEINGFTYDNSEELGNAFEYLLSILGSQGDAGQFRTPRHIIDFIVEVVDPKKTDNILDPACGTAGFLISAYKHIKHQNSSNYKQSEYLPSFSKKAVKDVSLIEIQSNGDYTGDKLTPDNRKKLGQNIIGYDISPDMVRLSLVNMYLHGFNTPQIFEYDSLTYEDRWGDMFDIVLANPPFMSPKGGIRPHKRFQIQANRSELLFVDYIAEHLTLKGRAGVIVPEGIIFQSSNAYKNLRKMLIEDNFLWAVVSLPAGVFKPYSGVKTSILFLDRERAKQNDEILFVKVSNDGFDLGDQRRAINTNDLPDAYTILQNWQNDNKTEIPIASWVEKKVILESGDYNLTGDRYRLIVSGGEASWPLVPLTDICEIYQPKTISQNDMKADGQYVVFGANGVIGRYDKFNHEHPEVLITCRGATCGTVNMSTPKSWITGNAMVVTPKVSNVLKDYLYYVLREADLQPTISGSAQPQITRQGLSPFRIPLPPLEAQKEIVAELDGYQRVIDGARQIVANWKPTIKIDPKWPMVKLGEGKYFSIESGGTPDTKKSEYWDGDINWITLVDLPQSDFVTNITSSQKKITQQGLKKSSAKLLPENTVVVSSRATIGRVGIVRTPLATNQGFKNIVIKDRSEVNETFVAFMVLRLVPDMIRLGSGGTYKEISKTNFSNLEIPLPPIDIQKQIVDDIEREQTAVESAKKLIELHEQKIKNKIAEVWGEES